jgi:hypothetical protein
MTMLVAFSLLCALGLRYPLQMLPVLLWELLWKLVWLAAIALPQWLADAMTPSTRQTLIDCAPLVLLIAAIPWGYVWRAYVTRPSERAPRAAAAGGASQ